MREAVVGGMGPAGDGGGGGRRLNNSEVENANQVIKPVTLQANFKKLKKINLWCSGFDYRNGGNQY